MQPSHFSGTSSTSTSAHHAPNAWGTSSTNSSFGESLSQSRSHYQSGYLMSAAQNNNSPQGHQRVEQAPVVPTKAKLNQVLTRGSASDFGMESMFQSTSRQRQNLADEDAPPMTSVDDIPNEVMTESTSTRFQPRQSTLNSSQFGNKRHTKAPTAVLNNEQKVYLVVFGYPPDKFTFTSNYFADLGGDTEPETNTEIVNCFRIGFSDPTAAARAVRKNGELLQGSFMIGVKWADQLQGDALLSQLSGRSGPSGDADGMNVDSPAMPSSVSNNNFHAATPSFGTPIRLEPSTSALRRPGAPGGSKPATPLTHSSPWASSPSTPANGGGGGAGSSPAVPASSSNKSMLGQVSDLIFGW